MHQPYRASAGFCVVMGLVAAAGAKVLARQPAGIFPLSPPLSMSWWWDWGFIALRHLFKGCDVFASASERGILQKRKQNFHR